MVVSRSSSLPFSLIIYALLIIATYYPIVCSLTNVLFIEPLPPPINIHLKNVSKGQIEFTWEPVTCTDIHYNIESVNCGRCPNTTSASNVTCTDVKITDRQTCIFGVSTVACSNLVGTNNTIEVQLEGNNNLSYKE